MNDDINNQYNNNQFNNNDVQNQIPNNNQLNNNVVQNPTPNNYQYPNNLVSNIDYSYEPPKKNNTFKILILLVILIGVGYFAYNKYIKNDEVEDKVIETVRTNNDEEKIKLIKEKLIGNWSMVNHEENDGDMNYLMNYDLVFYEDDTFYISGNVKINGGSVWSMKGNGKYVFNTNGSKIKFEYDEGSSSKFYNEFKDLEIENDSLIIGDHPYFRVNKQIESS